MARKKDNPTTETTPPEVEDLPPVLDVAPLKPEPMSLKKEKAAPKRPRTVIPMGIRLEVFLRLAGRKQDQLAGFTAYARSQKLRPMPVAEWRKALHEFDRQPTK